MPEPIDPVVRLLLKSPLTPAQRRSASEAFTGSTDEDDLSAKMDSLGLPKSVKAGLWDLKSQAPKQAPIASTEPQGSAAGRFLENAGEILNPVTMVKGVRDMLPIPEALGGKGIIGGPMGAASNILAQSNAQRLKAHEAQDRGDYGEMAARSLAAAIPVARP